MQCLKSMFLCGYHIKIGRNTFTQDAFVSSLVAFFVALSLPMGVCTIFYMDLPQTRGIRSAHLYYTLCACMTLAMVVMVTMMGGAPCGRWVVHPNQGQGEVPDDVQRGQGVAGDEDRHNGRINKYFQSHVTIIGMGVFFVIGLVDDVSNAIGGFMCLTVFSNCHDPTIIEFYYNNSLPFVVFSVVRPLFLGTMFLFCIKMHGKRLKKCAKVRYSLVTVLLAAAAVWIHANLREVNEQVHSKHNTANVKPHLVGTDNVEVVFSDNKSTAVLRGHSTIPMSDDCNRIVVNMNHTNNPLMLCLQKKTPIAKFVAGTFSFIYPLHIEMTFLVIELLAHLTSLLTCRDEDDDGQEDDGDVEDNEEESQHLLDQNAAQVAPRANNGACFNVFFCLIVILVIILVIVHILLAFFTRWDTEPSAKEYSNQYRYMYNMEQIVYWAVFIVVLVLSFILCSNFKSIYTSPEEHQYDGIELMFLVASLGIFYSGTVHALACYFCFNGTDIKVPLTYPHVKPDDIPSRPPQRISLPLFIVFILDTVSTILLTVLVVHAGRLKQPLRARKRVKAFKLTLLVSAILNLGVWFAFGFGENSNPHIDQVSDFYFFGKSGQSSWENIAYIISPISLFYRFTAAILLMKIYFK